MDQPNCLHCGRNYHSHLEVFGVGHVCPKTVSTYEADTRPELKEKLAQAEEQLDRTRGLLKRAKDTSYGYSDDTLRDDIEKVLEGT